MTTFSLRNLRLRPGEEYRDEQRVELQPLDLGGQRYQPVPEAVPAELSIERVSSGTVFGLAFAVRLHGPCYRCLEDAVLDLPVKAREYQATDPGEEEELTTPYVADDTLDLSAWARDSVTLMLPDQILCRPDCAGLCPVCGDDLNTHPHTHEEAAAYSRWAALEELRNRL